MKTIPVTVKYVLRQGRNMMDINGRVCGVFDAYPVDAESKASERTALLWAVEGTSSWTFDGPGGDGVKYINEYKPVVIERKNEAFAIRIFKLDRRTKNPSVYKVLDDDDNLFDLRENQLIEVIAMCGIEPGGKIKGKFLWYKNHGHMTLILENGNIHKELQTFVKHKDPEDVEVEEETLIPVKDLVPGKVYTDKANCLPHIYVGKLRVGKRIYYARMRHDLYLARLAGGYRHLIEITSKTTFVSENASYGFYGVNSFLEDFKKTSEFENGFGEKFKFAPNEIEWL